MRKSNLPRQPHTWVSRWTLRSDGMIRVNRLSGKQRFSLKPLTTLARSTWGAGLMQLRRIYQLVVVPALLYGCSAWYVLKSSGEHHETRLRSLNKIHTRAMLAITGAHRTISTAALNIETYQLPMRWLLEKQMLDTLVRVATTRARDQVGTARRGETMGRGHLRPDWYPWGGAHFSGSVSLPPGGWGRPTLGT